MKSNLLFIIALLGFHFTYGQFKSRLIDAETQEPISFAHIWLENGKAGTNSNKKGKFVLNKVTDTSTVYFSAISYHTKNLLGKEITKVIKLKPSITELQEVEIKNRKFEKQLIVGEFEKSDIKTTHANFTGHKSKVGRYIAYQEVFKETPYIQKIKVATKSKVKEAKFNVALYAVNSDKNQAEELIVHENIILTVKRGKKITEIDLSSYAIPFPKYGLLVSLEWLAIESNIGPKRKLRHMDGQKRTYTSLEPRFGTIQLEPNEIAWNHYSGTWQKNNINNLFYIEYRKTQPAIELTLSN